MTSSHPPPPAPPPAPLLPSFYGPRSFVLSTSAHPAALRPEQLAAAATHRRKGGSGSTTARGKTTTEKNKGGTSLFEATGGTQRAVASVSSTHPSSPWSPLQPAYRSRYFSTPTEPITLHREEEKQNGSSTERRGSSKRHSSSSSSYSGSQTARTLRRPLAPPPPPLHAQMAGSTHEAQREHQQQDVFRHTVDGRTNGRDTVDLESELRYLRADAAGAHTSLFSSPIPPGSGCVSPMPQPHYAHGDEEGRTDGEYRRQTGEGMQRLSPSSFLPSLSSSRAASTRRSSAPHSVPQLPLQKLVVSSALDSSSVTVAPAPHPHHVHTASTAAFNTSSTRLNSFQHTRAASSSSPPSVSSFRSMAPSSRQALLTRNLVSQPLKGSAASNLASTAPSWANPRLLTWKRQQQYEKEGKGQQEQKAKTEGQVTDAVPSSSSSCCFPPAPPLPSPRRRRGGAHAQFDPVSELHGFLSQKNVKQLLKQTNYNRRELYVIFVRFKALCALSPSPHGIDKQTFKKGVARLAVEDDLFVERVFELVDDDNSGQIEWVEFLSAMSALEKGDPEAKVKFFFQVYDVDNDGFISKRDLATMFHSSSMLDEDATTQEVVDTFVDKVFKQFGASESGKIAFEDVVRYMKKEGAKKDVWDVFGRSMLQDFTSRPQR